MGFCCSLKENFKIIYNFKIDKDLWEHEYNHVVLGSYNGKINPNSKEVSDYRWISLNQLSNALTLNYQKYTPWFKLILENYFFKSNIPVK